MLESEFQDTIGLIDINLKVYENFFNQSNDRSIPQNEYVGLIDVKEPVPSYDGLKQNLYYYQV